MQSTGPASILEMMKSVPGSFQPFNAHTSPLPCLAKSEIQELRKELERQKADAQEAKKALENRIIEERVRSGELDPDEVSRERINRCPTPRYMG